MYKASNIKKSAYREASARIVSNFKPMSKGSAKQSERTVSSRDPLVISARMSAVRLLQSPETKATVVEPTVRLTAPSTLLDSPRLARRKHIYRKDVLVSVRGSGSLG